MKPTEEELMEAYKQMVDPSGNGFTIERAQSAFDHLYKKKENAALTKKIADFIENNSKYIDDTKKVSKKLPLVGGLITAASALAPNISKAASGNIKEAVIDSASSLGEVLTPDLIYSEGLNANEKDLLKQDKQKSFQDLQNKLNFLSGKKENDPMMSIDNSKMDTNVLDNALNPQPIDATQERAKYKDLLNSFKLRGR